MTGAQLLIGLASVWATGALAIWGWAIWSGRNETRSTGEAVFLSIAIAAGAAWPIIVLALLVALLVFCAMGGRVRPASSRRWGKS